MKKALVLFVLCGVLMQFALVQSAELRTCFPEYECGDWGECDGIFQYRTCVDERCGMRDINEKLFCEIEERAACTPDFVCEEWGPCIFTEAPDNVISGVISFGGYRARVCRDMNNCVDDFIDESMCAESLEFQLITVTECGKRYLVANNIETGGQLTKISLDELAEHKLYIVTSQSRVVYCDECYNAVRDGNETGVDCGGECMPCADVKEGVPIETIEGLAWIFAVVFFVLFLVEAFSYNKKRKKRKARRGKI